MSDFVTEYHAGQLYVITAPHFVAGLVFSRFMLVNEAAPIIHYMIGWTPTRVSKLCEWKGWSLLLVAPSTDVCAPRLRPRAISSKSSRFREEENDGGTV